MTLLLLLGGSGPGTSTAEGEGGPAGSSVILEFSPTTNPMESPVWVDITPWLRFKDGITIRRGRSSELDDFVAGTASCVLDNRDRRFDPTNTAGPYHSLNGNELKPRRRFRISLRYNSVTYTRFVGFCRGWPQRYDVSKREAFVPLELDDAFALLAQANGTEAQFVLDDLDLGVLDVNRLGGAGEFAEELSGARVDTVLDLVGWDDFARDLDDGESLLNAAGISGAALEYLKNVERSEDGYLYVSRDGDVTFYGRFAPLQETRMTTSQATFTDDGTAGDGRYHDIGYDYDDTRVFNDIRRTRDGGTEQAVQNSTSVERYFLRTHSETGLLLTSDEQAASVASFFLDRYREPAVRLPELEVRPLRDPTVLMPAVLARELLDRITVELTPMDVGAQNVHQCLIEGYEEQWNPKDIRFRFSLSTTYDPDVFILDDATAGELDVRVLA